MSTLVESTHSLTQPILASLRAHTLSAATLLAVGNEEGVDVWVALRVFISLMYHLYSVSMPGQPLE